MNLEKEPLPGPGAFEASSKTIGNISSRASFGAKIASKPKEGPGPGQYDTVRSSVLKGSPSKRVTAKQANVMPLSKRPEIFLNKLMRDLPGPGNYSTPTAMGSGKACQFGAKLKVKTSDTPGVGAYDVY